MRGIAVPWNVIFWHFWLFMARSFHFHRLKQMAEHLHNKKLTMTRCISQTFCVPVIQPSTLWQPFKKVSLSENQTKNQSWKQYGRQTWARWKWELERSTCRVCLCWELQHRPFSTWLHIWTIERKYNWTRNLKEAEEAGCNVQKRKSSISLYPSIDFGAICSERDLAVSAPDEMGNTGQNLPRPCPFHFVTIQFQI